VYSKKIVKSFSDLDAKIEINNCINTELEAMAKKKCCRTIGLYSFDFPDANGKPHKSVGGNMV
jgi:type I restriction enzyme S subunit